MAAMVPRNAEAAARAGLVNRLDASSYGHTYGVAEVCTFVGCVVERAGRSDLAAT
jgi:hypothetical protein